MARVLSQTLIRTTASSSSSLLQSFRLGLWQLHRFSSQSGKAKLIEVDLESEGEVEVIGLRKLEDVIHGIIVKKSAPDWLPFIPGSSYWVPPRRQGADSTGIVEVLSKFAQPMSEDESMSLISSRGWPSLVYYLGSSPVNPLPVEIEVEVKVQSSPEIVSQAEDEEG